MFRDQVKLVILISFVFCTIPVFAQDGQSLTRDQLIDGILLIQKFAEDQGPLSQKPPEGIPQVVWDELIQKINFNEKDRIHYQIWSENFSDQELKEIFDFYSSPTGKKFINKLTPLMQEIRTQQGAWTLKQLSYVIEGLKEKGYNSAQLNQQYKMLLKISEVKKKPQNVGVESNVN